jgi:NAD+ kinase
MIFEKIGVITNKKRDPMLLHTDKLTKYLSGRHNINIINMDAVNSHEEELYKTCDLFIVLGGDGTMLKIVPEASRYDIPVIGVNLGKVGFMNEIEPGELYLLDNLFEGNYEIKSRMMLNVEIVKEGGGALHAGTVLNDAVVTHGAFAKLIEIDVACDGVKVADYRSDGVIAATPTGSTAYSMSAGGPIIDPDVECLCITPVCPHSLVNRPMIFSGGSVLEIKSRNTKTDAYLTLDGRINIRLGENDTVRIKKSGFTAKLAAIKKHGFYDIIKNKLGGNF